MSTAVGASVYGPEWQAAFVTLLDELDESFGHLDWPSYRVNAVDKTTGRFKRDPIPHYNRGRTQLRARITDV